MSDPSETLRIGCWLVNGVRLRLFAPMYDADTGLSPLKFTGEEIVLAGTMSDTDTSQARGRRDVAPGETAIPRPFWDAWLKANTDSLLLRNGLVFEMDHAAGPEAENP